MRAVFGGANIRLLSLTFCPQSDLILVQLSPEHLDLCRLSITLVLQTVALLHQVGTQRMTVLQLAIQGGASVLGEVLGGPCLRCASFSDFQPSLPVFTLFRQLGLVCF